MLFFSENRFEIYRYYAFEISNFLSKVDEVTLRLYKGLSDTSKGYTEWLSHGSDRFPKEVEKVPFHLSGRFFPPQRRMIVRR